jgi:hypothetical protein
MANETSEKKVRVFQSGHHQWFSWKDDAVKLLQDQFRLKIVVEDFPFKLFNRRVKARSFGYFRIKDKHKDPRCWLRIAGVGKRRLFLLLRLYRTSLKT